MSKRKKAMQRNDVLEYHQYLDKLSGEEKKWVKQFYKEYYGNDSYNQECPIITADEHLQEARRNHNSLYRDALSVTKTLASQEEFTPDQMEVIELAGDESDYELAFSQGGYELASETVMNQAIRDLDAGQDKKVVLSRFYIKFERLRKMKQRDDKVQRELNKKEEDEQSIQKK